MEIAMVGLGQMGVNMATRLMRGNHRVVAFDLNEEAIQRAEAQGAEGVRNINELRNQLFTPRTEWVMVPSGDPTEKTIEGLTGLLENDDIIIDGGYSNCKDSMHRASMLKEKGLHFVDIGTSGGIWELSEGYSMMVGGEKPIVESL